MRCLIKSWRCETCGREEWIEQPSKIHAALTNTKSYKDIEVNTFEKCKGKWITYEWSRKTKPAEAKE